MWLASSVGKGSFMVCLHLNVNVDVGVVVPAFIKGRFVPWLFLCVFVRWANDRYQEFIKLRKKEAFICTY